MALLKGLSTRDPDLNRYKNLPQSLSENGSYLHAYEECIFYQDKNVDKFIDVLNKKLVYWFIDNTLPINFGR